MKAIFGGLLEFENNSKLDEFAETVDDSTSIKVIENAIEYGMKNGIYSLEEAFCLYKCLSKVKRTIKSLETPF